MYYYALFILASFAPLNQSFAASCESLLSSSKEPVLWFSQSNSLDYQWQFRVLKNEAGTFEIEIGADNGWGGGLSWKKRIPVSAEIVQNKNEPGETVEFVNKRERLRVSFAISNGRGSANLKKETFPVALRQVDEEFIQKLLESDQDLIPNRKSFWRRVFEAQAW